MEPSEIPVEPSERDEPLSQVSRHAAGGPSAPVAPDSLASPIIGHLGLEERHFVEDAALTAGDGRDTAKKLTLSAVVLCTGVVAFAWPVQPGVWTLLYPTLLIVWLMPPPSVLIGREVFRGQHVAIRNAKVIIDATQIRMEGVQVEVHRPWSHFGRWSETDTLFILHGAGRSSALWNKEAFAPEDLPRLRALLGAQIKPQPAPRPAPGTAAPAWRRRLGALAVSAVLALYLYWRSQ